jgi:DNA-binding XRE family transcriptional regulator
MVNHIQALRRLRGLTQEQLATQLGVHPSVVSRWERGVRLPSLPIALRLADALACRVDDLFSIHSHA